MPDLTPYLQLGATAIVAIVGYWAIAKMWSKKSDNSEINIAENLRRETANIASELKLQNENHLTHIGDDINTGFDRMCEKQETCTIRICNKLDTLILAIGEIKGMNSR